MGDELEWDVELAIPSGAIEPVKLGKSGRLGWTTWMLAELDVEARPTGTIRTFDPTERLRPRRGSRTGSLKRKYLLF